MRKLYLLTIMALVFLTACIETSDSYESLDNTTKNDPLIYKDDVAGKCKVMSFELNDKKDDPDNINTPVEADDGIVEWTEVP